MMWALDFKGKNDDHDDHYHDYELVIGAPSIRPDGKIGLAHTMRMRVRPLCALTLLLLLLPLLFHSLLAVAVVCVRT